MVTRRGFGWEPEFPDYRDKRLRDRLDVKGLPGNIPRKFSLREFDSPVRDQGELGSCTGFAAAAVVDFLRRTDADSISTVYSAQYAYYHNRLMDGPEWVLTDSGAYVRDACKVLVKVGACPESAWTYSHPF